ncbi:MAG: hypothetical protein J0M18_14915 [Ignavibacteria bacterium]|nr:hypothetical protein [Ignavibacteria bacterium]
MEDSLRHNVPGMSPKNKSKVKRGFKIVLFIIIFILGYVVSYYFIIPSVFPKSIRGDLQNIRAFPSADGKYKLWIQNDGTLRFTSRTNNMGQISLKTKGWFCRTYSYVYDPASKDVLNGFKTSFDDLPPVSDIIYENGKIWLVNSSSEGVPPEIRAYNSENYQQILNTQSFCEKNKELAAGIINVSVDNQKPVRFRISTKDGRELVYNPSDDKFFPNTIEFEKYYKLNDSTASGIFALVNEENSDKRKKLYYITGPKYDLYFSTSWAQEIVKQNMSAFKSMKPVEILPDKVFIEGNVLYTDDEIAVIVHQDNVGKTSNRMLTCVDKSGKELWTVQQKDLFDELEGKDDDSRTEMFFLRTQLDAQRAGNVVVFIYKPAGAIGFQVADGKKLWEYEG